MQREGITEALTGARHQWTIRKHRRGQRTTTTIELLGEPDRLEELASMLRGKARGETTRREAAAMLAEAKKFSDALQKRWDASAKRR